MCYYRHISWVVQEESFALTTKFTQDREEEGDHLDNLIRIIAIFSVMPFAFVCMFEVTRDVSIPARQQPV